MGAQEWLIVLLIVVLIFGARKLPELARSLGSSAKEFRKGIEDGSREAEGDDASRASSVETDATETKSSDSREATDS